MTTRGLSLSLHQWKKPVEGFCTDDAALNMGVGTDIDIAVHGDDAAVDGGGGQDDGAVDVGQTPADLRTPGRSARVPLTVVTVSLTLRALTQGDAAVDRGQ